MLGFGGMAKRLLEYFALEGEPQKGALDELPAGYKVIKTTIGFLVLKKI